MFALVLTFDSPAEASADIDFKSAGPVSILVDGRQAAQSSPLRHKMSGLEPGVHALKVVGMFGKTLYEAEIDLPDNTITYASWDRGEIKVLSTDWLPKDTVAAAELTDTGSDDEAVAVVEVTPPAEPAPLEAPVAAEQVVAIPAAPPAAPAMAPSTDALASLEELPAPAAPVDQSMFAIAPAPAAEPVLPKGRTLTVQAADGMRIEVVHDGQMVVVVVDGDAFRIEDGSGLSMALGGAD